MINIIDYEVLPGAEFVLDGIEKLKEGKVTEATLLVEMGARRLRAVGIEVPEIPKDEELPSHRLYHLLAEKYGNGAHSKYNASVRRLVSFQRAAGFLRNNLVHTSVS